VSTASGYFGCDLCLATIEGQVTQVQYSRGAFVYGESQIRVTPDRSRLRDVQVCGVCTDHLRGRLAYLIAERGRPARSSEDPSESHAS